MGAMQQYVGYLRDILEKGDTRVSRNGEIISSFGHHMHFDLRKGFPHFTGRHVPFDVTKKEYLWFTSGSTNVKDLHEQGVHLWDLWADPETGECPYIYGQNWTRWPDMRVAAVSEADTFKNRGFKLLNTFINGELGDLHPGYDSGVKLVTVYREINQLENLVDSLTHDPYGRRHVLDGWNVATQAEAALPACHAHYQFYVSNGELSCHFYNRSSDAGLGGAFNISGAALITHMLAQQCGYEVGDLYWTVGDGHIYGNQLEAISQLLEQVENNELPALPRLKLNKAPSICEYTPDDIELVEYNPLPKIKIPVSQ